MVEWDQSEVLHERSTFCPAKETFGTNQRIGNIPELKYCVIEVILPLLLSLFTCTSDVSTRSMSMPIPGTPPDDPFHSSNLDSSEYRTPDKDFEIGNTLTL